MPVEMEGQSNEVYQRIKNREIQQESVKKLNELGDLIDNVDFDGIESDTKDIKSMIYGNLESQTNIDDLAEDIGKALQGIADIKRNQTNINKKINDIQDKIGD